jgi:LemA protein
MIAIIIIVIFLILVPIFIYNGLIRKKNAVDNAFHSIDVMLKKRYDLIPRLVETVKGYMNYEKEILLKLTELRAQAINDSQGTNKKVELDNEITTRISQVLVSVEKYPDLKASRNFLNLQGALNETEEQLAASRRFYNAAVTDYHNGIETFPSSLVAGWMGMKPRNFFTIPDEERSVPAISMN